MLCFPNDGLDYCKGELCFPNGTLPFPPMKYCYTTQSWASNCIEEECCAFSMMPLTISNESCAFPIAPSLLHVLWRVCAFPMIHLTLEYSTLPTVVATICEYYNEIYDTKRFVSVRMWYMTNKFDIAEVNINLYNLNWCFTSISNKINDFVEPTRNNWCFFFLLISSHQLLLFILIQY